MEYSDGLHLATVPAGADFIVVKAGQVYTWLGSGSYYSDKDISFIITCWDDEPNS